MTESKIENLSYEATIGVDIRRYKEFSGVKIDIPENVRHWVSEWDDNGSGVEQWIIPNDVLYKKARKSRKRFLERADQIKKHCHGVLTANFLENYKAGNTFRCIDYEDFGEKGYDVLDLSEDQLSRVYQFSGYDHWVRRCGEILHRDIQIEAWPTYYGEPEDIEKQVKKNSRFVSIYVSPNRVWQNHDILGLWNVWIRLRLSDEELATFIKKESRESFGGRIYALEELLGLKRKKS